ncbi:alpha/beta hydrolase [Rhizomicrobium electricum]|uniref:Alpha/beta hydrolase n=1 Tax=Rhizomicrobium electricum TaxID=480070 RepID=A0ABP3QD46_9PROT|nr:alpha/beta hydrolase [Rhizomicrobium electricum]NIJ50638.1 acetyl esterase/lipase [Rhizomicrobium electricum]
MKRRTVLGLGAAALATMAARAGTAASDGSLTADPAEIIPLWPATPPGGEAVHLTTRIVERSTELNVRRDRYADNVGKPILTVFRPARPDGSAIVLAPGGGYIRNVIDTEAFESARRFSAAGITVFVLYYRLPGDGWANRSDVPLQDIQRAVRLVRAYAGHYGLDPARVGVLGFSAGGHVVASLATRYADKVYAPVDTADDLEARPAFVGLLYPVITMSEKSHLGSREKLLGPDPSPDAVAKYSCERHVNAATPPSFIALAGDDKAVPPMANGVAFYEALFTAKVPVEMHAFAVGGHGFGIRWAAGKPGAAWPDLFLKWGVAHKWFRGEIA